MDGSQSEPAQRFSIMTDQEPNDPRTKQGLSRRSFLKGAGGAAAATSFAAQAVGGQDGAVPEGAATLSGTSEVKLTVNGESRAVLVEPRTTLLSALRDRMEPALTGTKLVCDMGSCGACTVVVDGQPVYSCMTLAARCEGKAITTIEGFGSPDKMSDVQDAFCEKDGLMCGFCTPGFVVATHVALDRKPDASLDELKYELSGNLCRCGTYPHIFEAAKVVQESRAAAGNGAKKEGAGQ